VPETPQIPNRRRRVAATVVAALTTLSLAGLAACGDDGSSGSSAVEPNAPEQSPPGDIPDDQVFVPYQFPDGSFTVKVPEGWSRTEDAGTVTFTDEFNSIALSTRPTAAAPTVASAERDEVPAIEQAVPGYEAGKVETVTRSAGDAVRITYRGDSPPDAVTGGPTTLDVERYELFHGGDEIVLVLSGPKGADNVDPWQLVTDSVRFGP